MSVEQQFEEKKLRRTRFETANSFSGLDKTKSQLDDLLSSLEPGKRLTIRIGRFRTPDGLYYIEKENPKKTK